MPEAQGGAGLGIAEATVTMQAVAAAGAGAASARSMNVFGPNPVVRFATEAQRARMLRPLIEGRETACFAVAEPTTDLDTTQLTTGAVRQVHRSVVHGLKGLDLHRAGRRPDAAAGADHADRGSREARPGAEPAPHRARPDPRGGARDPEDGGERFTDGLPIPAGDPIGEEGQGFRQVLHGLNPERIPIAGERVGIAGNACAARRARERVVFGRPIGHDQSVQHPRSPMPGPGSRPRTR